MKKMNIVFALLILCWACDKSDVIETIIVNETDKNLKLTLFSSLSDHTTDLNVLAESTAMWSGTNINSGRVPPTTAVFVDTAIIEFVDTKKLLFTLEESPTEMNILLEESYTYDLEETRGKCYHRYRYLVTDEHYDKAE